MIYGGVSLSNTMPTKNNNAAMASMMNNIRILYPRAGTLGGCTAHNAMITVYPHNSDWDKLAEITEIRLGRATTCASILSAWNNADI